MRYINDPDTKAKTYQEVVEAAIASGVEAQRAYIFLAGLGVKGVLARVMSEGGNGYGEAVKLAVINNERFVSKVGTCAKCGSLEVS